MNKDTIQKVGIDLGSRSIKVVVALEDKKSGKLNILGATKELSEGIVSGQILSHKDALICLKRAIKKTEKALNIEIKQASIGVSSNLIKHQQVRVKQSVARSTNEVGQLDLDRTKEESLKKIDPSSPLEVLHTHLSYLYLDGKRISGNPIGLIGHTLETIYTITTIPKKYLENIIQLFDELGVQILEVCDNSFISSVVLTKSKERHHGIGILDIGCDQSTLTLYENDLPVLAKHFPIGGNSFTKDISICMGITVEEAETMKKSYKQSDARHDSKKDERKLGQIIDARIDDVAQVLSRELAKIIESTQIPNGLILTGGGALLAGIKDKLRHKLAMPVVDGKEILRNATEDVLQDTTWTNAYALTFLDSGEQSVFKSIFSPVLSYFKKLFSKIAP